MYSSTDRSSQLAANSQVNNNDVNNSNITSNTAVGQKPPALSAAPTPLFYAASTGVYGDEVICRDCGMFFESFDALQSHAASVHASAGAAASAPTIAQSYYSLNNGGGDNVNNNNNQTQSVSLHNDASLSYHQLEPHPVSNHEYYYPPVQTWGLPTFLNYGYQTPEIPAMTTYGNQQMTLPEISLPPLLMTNHQNVHQTTASNAIMAPPAHTPPRLPPARRTNQTKSKTAVGDKAAAAAGSSSSNQAHVYACQYCDKSYDTFQALAGHSQKHNRPNKKYQKRSLPCETCGKTFSSTRTLKEHTYIHENYFRYDCKACNKQFRQTSAFIAHKRTAAHRANEATANVSSTQPE